MTALRVAAVVEALSLLVLVVNRFTAHLAPITSITGPVHGTAYLAVIAATALLPGAPRAAKLLAWVPGIGGALVLRRLRASRSASPGR